MTHVRLSLRALVDLHGGWEFVAERLGREAPWCGISSGVSLQQQYSGLRRMPVIVAKALKDIYPELDVWMTMCDVESNYVLRWKEGKR